MCREVGNKIDTDFTDLGTDFTESSIRASVQPHRAEQLREIRF